MKDGFIRVACATPLIRVASPQENAEAIWEQIKEARKQQVKLMVFPELCLTGYTCSDLFLQDALLQSAWDALKQLLHKTRQTDMLIAVGLPFMYQAKLYNVAAYMKNGELLGLVPKTSLPNYAEFYEIRHFSSGADCQNRLLDAAGLGLSQKRPVWFGTRLLFHCENVSDLVIACELCEDVWTPCPPSVAHTQHGATVICNLSASDEATGKADYRKALIGGQSARLICAYLYASAGEGESTTDLVFSAHNMIMENGTCLAESERFTANIQVADVDLQRLRNERRRMTTFATQAARKEEEYATISFSYKTLVDYERLFRNIVAMPFVPDDTHNRRKRCEEIFMIQSMGLKTRLRHTGISSAVLGISGGLDSTLALLVTVRAFDMLHISRKNITAITMPCFGTTDRTYRNACLLVKKLGATLREIDICQSVRQHFADIAQDEGRHDVTYENAQARERTQILMDVANQLNGLVIGTGDLSELALGWATYNGDHMSMYAVNASVPKTLVRHLVSYYAEVCAADEPELAQCLRDILDTPVSPELLPPTDGQISQKTEDIVGPYELHDFFLYQLIRLGYSPKKIYRMTCQAFEGRYDKECILKWLRVFYRRFFAQQFKRSCLPDGPRVGSVAVSPRGDWRMPSDASVKAFMKEIDEIICQ